MQNGGYLVGEYLSVEKLDDWGLGDLYTSSAVLFSHQISRKHTDHSITFLGLSSKCCTT